MENSVPVRCGHARVNEEAGVAKLCDLLGQQLHSGHRVTKNNCLVDLELGEQSVEAMNLLPLFNKCTTVHNTLSGRFILQVDFMCICHEAILDVQDGLGESGRVHQNLAFLGKELDEILNDWSGQRSLSASSMATM